MRSKYSVMRGGGATLICFVLLFFAGCAGVPSTAQKSYAAIDPAQARRLHDEGAVFIDLRLKSLFEAGHVPGAINLTWGRGYSERRLVEAVDRDQVLVIYCYGIACDISMRATEQARAWGFREVYHFMKGFPAWQAAGYPVDT